MRNVVVTGASRGLGLEMARTLAAAGYRVIAVARRSSEELAAAAKAAADGGNGGGSAAAGTVSNIGAIEFRAFDLSELEKISSFVRSLRADFGPLYGLVNNAGMGSAGVLSLMGDHEIERLVRLNTLSPIVLTKYVARSMMTERAGRIINIASIVASAGQSGLSVYAATKASLIGFTKSLAREVGPLGITVNAIAPGYIETDMTAELDESQKAKIARRSALRRMAERNDVARSAEFLLGDGGRNITGIVLTVDAGRTA